MPITFMTNVDRSEIIDKIYDYTNEIYFNIDDNGFISLKPEYRGESSDTELTYSLSDTGLGNSGSLIEMLPENIVIPNSVNGITVTGYQAGMFHYNYKVKKIVLSDNIRTIPDSFCSCAKYLTSIENTEHIENLGDSAFSYTRIEKAIFSNLKECGDRVFYACPFLKIADIGDITAIGDYMFRSCNSLISVKGGSKVTSIGITAFRGTHSLVNLPLLDNKNAEGKSAITTLRKGAFISTRIQFDWTKLDNVDWVRMRELEGVDYTLDINSVIVELDKTYGHLGIGNYYYYTPIADNIESSEHYSDGNYDYWSDFKLYDPTKDDSYNKYSYKPCVNPLKTLFHQKNPEWANEIYLEAGSTRTYGGVSCAFFSTAHIYSAIYDVELTSPIQFENDILVPALKRKGLYDEVKSLAPGDAEGKSTRARHKALFCKDGEEPHHRAGSDTNPLTKDDLKEIYDALYEGAYILLGRGAIRSPDQGHAVVLYGVNDKGELLVADSDGAHHAVGEYKAYTFAMPFQNMCNHAADYYIVKKVD